MLQNSSSILCLNGGSSSVKFALYRSGDERECTQRGRLERIGLSGTTLTFLDSAGAPQEVQHISASDYSTAAQVLFDNLETRCASVALRAVGHRIVHGMQHHEPELVTQDLLDELYRISPFDPEHLPSELCLIEAFRHRHPETPQVACFDTAFHHNMPNVARLLPIPRRFGSKGVKRYGFHGLSYAYVTEELARLGDPAVRNGRVILAHLGNGASLAALRDGACVDTSMGFTPAAGLMMGTRSGDLDPGLLPYLARTEQMTTNEFHEMITHQSGLLGVSEISSDMRDLLLQEDASASAAEAVALFCYQATKWIGSFVAVLGGLDTFVFTGGIGENSSVIRERICETLGFLGIELDREADPTQTSLISSASSRVAVRVIRTDEELMIVRSVNQVLSSA